MLERTALGTWVVLSENLRRRHKMERLMKTHVDGIVFLGVEVDWWLEADKGWLVVAARERNTSLHHSVVQVTAVDRVAMTRQQ